ncbi:MAG: carotenoid oxygenase family protein [Actinomycetes bacterium]
MAAVEDLWAGVDEPYLIGQYEPIRDERDDADLTVIGELPEGLRGTYLRNGPNSFFPPPGRYHVFDGDGMVHGITFDGSGGAQYRNRWIQSRGLNYEQKVGHAVYGGLSEFALPDADAINEGGIYKNTANTNVIRHGGRVLALMEGGRPTELADDLATLGEYDFGGALQGSMTAHPKWDPATGEMLFFGYSPFPPFLRYHVADAAGNLLRSTEVPIGRSVMMHDFAFTENYVVWFDLPAIFDGDALMTGGGPSIYWDRDAGARIGIMPRDGVGADTSWIDVDPFYVFHFLNAYEADGKVIVDGCRSPEMPTAFGDTPTVGDDVRPCLWRWEIDDRASTVVDRQLDDRPGDFPRINDAVAGRRNRWGTQAHTGDWDVVNGVRFDGVVQFDLDTGASATHVYGPTHSSGEPVFAADPNGTAENDGWILNFVTDLAAGTTEFVVLDARDVAAEPVARVQLPRRVPFGFHGNWLPSAD